MDKISEISLEHTLSLKIDCVLNQQLLANNFNIVMNCLKDLQSQLHKHSTTLSALSPVKDLLDQLNHQVKQNTSKLNNQVKNTHNSFNNENHKPDHTELDSLKKQIHELKERMTKNEEFTTQNTKDINSILPDIKTVKQEIEILKKQLNEVKLGNNINTSNVNPNLGKNQNLSQQTLNILNKQLQQQKKAMNKFENQIQDMKKHINKLSEDITGLKTNFYEVLQDKKLQQIINNTENHSTDTTAGSIDPKAFNDIIKKLQYLTKKAQNIQTQVLSNTRSIHELSQTAEKTAQQIEQQKQNIDNIHLEINTIKKILDQLQNLNKNHNNLPSQIDKLKDQFDKLLKIINTLKNTNKYQNDSSHLDDKSNGSTKNIDKISHDRSFRKRSQSVDLNGRIRQLSDRIKHIEKLIGQENPQKLPSIGWKKANQTSYNLQKSHKKQLAQVKNDIQIWVKSYVESQNKGHGDLAEIELKIQQIKNVLTKKADHEGMKKGLAFLQGKITQLYLFLTEPETEDAMIVRKGFNCLSCSKKVENLRGKLGPRMNWDNLNVNNHGQTPPKAGFPKYGDSNQKDTI